MDYIVTLTHAELRAEFVRLTQIKWKNSLRCNSLEPHHLDNHHHRARDCNVVVIAHHCGTVKTQMHIHIRRLLVLGERTFEAAHLLASVNWSDFWRSVVNRQEYNVPINSILEKCTNSCMHESIPRVEQNLILPTGLFLFAEKIYPDLDKINIKIFFCGFNDTHIITLYVNIYQDDTTKKRECNSILLRVCYETIGTINIFIVINEAGRFRNMMSTTWGAR